MLFQLLATGDLAVIFQELFPPAVLSLSSLYAFCHYGEHLTVRFNDVSLAIYRLSWYEFPLKIQKDLVLFIGAAQNGVFLRGYAGTTCTRDVFKKVLF